MEIAMIGEQLKVNISQAIGYPIEGRYGILSKNLRCVTRFCYCREEFHSLYKSGKMCFVVEKKRSDLVMRRIAAFIEKIETKLNLKQKERTKIGPTNIPSIIWVHVSKWWSSCKMRRSLFTILLRVAQNYRLKIDNFEHTLRSHLYLSQTQKAVNWFLEGNTVYTGNVDGWYSQFYLYRGSVKLLKKAK